MSDVDTSLPALSKLIEQRLLLVRSLADSLELSTLSLAQNDAEAIARGAAHQAELCRQWSCLEVHLRHQTDRGSTTTSRGAVSLFPEGAPSRKLQAEWKELNTRIRYLTRVHSSLLRHLERSFAVLHRVVESCRHTYVLDPALVKNVWLETGLKVEARPRIGE